ncbi:MAG: uroporphyrinogen-III C-methyltransferase [Angustibacter sp.]
MSGSPARVCSGGQVFLVGAGPGGPDLLTVRGRQLLAEADVVVVDRLAPQDCLAGLAPHAEVVDVGKAPGRHSLSQQRINELLVAHARAGRRVVRLKGGDPYVLGRGGEEVQACRAAGVPVAVVPGVSSAFAVPAAAGIPVTHRGISASVTVLAGHEVPDARRLRALVYLGGTIVVLMGVGRLAELVGGLLAAGMAATTPAAVVERGWTDDQRTTRASLGELVSTCAARSVTNPAVIVVGDVVALCDDPTVVLGPLDTSSDVPQHQAGAVGGSR